MSEQSKVTIQRSKHDKQNPYVMISRDMFHDSSISIAAKGLLGYLLSLPNDWQIYHCQLQKVLNCGECALNSALKELLDAGYATRTRTRNDKGFFNPYSYEIFEFKIIQPDSIIQPGLSGLDNQALLKNESPTETKETTTKQQQVAAAPFEIRNKKKTALQEKGFFSIHDCLKEIDIPIPDKEEITRMYPEVEVKRSLAWATHHTTKISQSLQQAIKWACKNRPEIPKSSQDVVSENREKAQNLFQTISSAKPKNVYYEILNKNVEIGYLAGNCEPTVIEYSINGFSEQVMNALRKYGIPLKA